MRPEITLEEATALLNTVYERQTDNLTKKQREEVRAIRQECDDSRNNDIRGLLVYTSLYISASNEHQ